MPFTTAIPVLIAVNAALWLVFAAAAPVLTSLVVARLAPPSLRGEALGVFAALSTLAGGIGSLAGGALANAFGYVLAFAVAGIVIAAGAGLVVALRGISSRTNARSENEPTAAVRPPDFGE